MPSPTQLLMSFAVVAALLAATGAAHADRRSPPPVRHAHQVVLKISRHATDVQTELRFARGRGDRSRSRCLNQKLTEIHAQQRQATERASELASAHAQGNESAVRQARVMLTVLESRARNLSRQAERCGRV